MMFDIKTKTGSNPPNKKTEFEITIKINKELDY